MADSAGLHICSDFFTRLCKRHLGQTPLQLVATVRMSRAAELLVCTNYKLQVIADMVGYGTAFSLSAAFKRYYGVSPAAYRAGLR